MITASFNSVQALLDKSRNNSGLVLTLYKKLFEELPLQISCIEEALKTGQYELAFDVTHKLNGSAKICCLQDIEESAMALEKCLIQKRHGQTTAYFLILQQRISIFINHRQLILDYLVNKQ
jgi:HPt (histidine-containing phosphotransfer) domain-containing protein